MTHFLAPKITRHFGLLGTFVLLALSAAAQAPAWQWGLQTVNPSPTDGSDTAGNAVTTDAAGRVYVGGSFGEDPNGTAVATRTLPGAGTLGPGRGGFVAQATAVGQWAWVVPVLSQGALGGGRARASVTSVVATAAGDVYATGYVEGTGVRVGGLTHGLGSAGQALFVARLSSAGICQWLQTADDFTTLPTVALDPSTGGVVVAGTYRGSPSIGSTVLPLSTSSNGEAVFVARLNASGQWLAAAGATGSAGVISGVNMAVGPAGQVAVVSSQEAGSLTFGTHTLTVPPNTDETFVVAQLSPANQWQWAVGGGGSDISRAFGVAYTSAGALWVSGNGIAGTVVGSTTLVASPSTLADNYAGFMGQLSATGQWGTVRQLSPVGDGLAVFASLAVDGAGNAVGLGILLGYAGAVQANLGSQVLTSPGTGFLIFVATLNSAGQWRYVVAVPASSVPFGLTPAGTALDGSGNFYLAGSLAGGLQLGSSTLTGSFSGSTTSPVGSDAVLGKLANATTLAAHPAAPAQVVACFPNPAHAQATLHLPNSPTASRATLFDALGRPVRIYPLPAHASTAPLDLTGLAPGLYIVRCGAATGKLLVE